MLWEVSLSLSPVSSDLYSNFAAFREAAIGHKRISKAAPLFSRCPFPQQVLVSWLVTRIDLTISTRLRQWHNCGPIRGDAGNLKSEGLPFPRLHPLNLLSGCGPMVSLHKAFDFFVISWIISTATFNKSCKLSVSISSSTYEGKTINSWGNVFRKGFHGIHEGWLKRKPKYLALLMGKESQSRGHSLWENPVWKG